MIQDLENEIWMVHPIYTDYAASNYGRIKSLERDVCKEDGTFTRHQEEKLRKLQLTKDGYLRFNIYKNKKVVGYFVHRFCFECFYQMIIPNDRKKYQINHKNEDKQDNRVFENLELVTASQNINYGTRNNKISKRVGQYTLQGELVKIWESTRECERNSFKHSNVSKCCNNKYMREGNNIYKNFIWKYIE